MPELPEVETVVRDLRLRLPGKRILSARVYWERTVAGITPEAFSENITGRQIQAVDRRAKYIIIQLDQGLSMVVHLRMSGRLLVVGPDAPFNPYTRLSLEIDDGNLLVFNDTRKFGRIWLVDQAGLQRLLARLGPEPLTGEFNPAVFERMLQGRKTKLKPLLLDQAFLAGLGNIYVDEALWLAMLNPLRAANSLTQAEAERLLEAIKAVLNTGIQNQGTTFAMFVNPSGEPGQNQDSLKVYGRAGRGKHKGPALCERCGTPIMKMVVGQRGTHFCPVCQPMPEAR